MSTSMAGTVYERITGRIITLLEQGTVPWLRPWRATLPRNASNGHIYQGVNTLSCMALELERGFTCSAYVTYDQARKCGGWVRQGEHGVLLVLYKKVPKQALVPGDPEPEEFYFLAKGFTCFNLLQCGGLDELRKRLEGAPVDFNPSERCERLIAGTGAVIHHCGERAFYSPARDGITLPAKYLFHSPDAYYSTAFHELVHWTGAPHRLNRQGGWRFGDPRYAFEELTAEVGAAFLAARTSIDHTTQAAAYIQSWLGALRHDSRFLFAAAKKAGEAADYVYPLPVEVLGSAIANTAE
jgi:antirestriction protein ArdC